MKPVTLKYMESLIKSQGWKLKKLSRKKGISGCADMWTKTVWLQRPPVYSKQTMICVLAHELGHICQSQKGEFVPYLTQFDQEDDANIVLSIDTCWRMEQDAERFAYLFLLAHDMVSQYRVPETKVYPLRNTVYYRTKEEVDGKQETENYIREWAKQELVLRYGLRGLDREVAED